MNHPAKTKYKRYDEAFKRQAVEHWLVSGQSGRRIVAKPGINEQRRKGWKHKFKQLPAGQMALTPDMASPHLLIQVQRGFSFTVSGFPRWRAQGGAEARRERASARRRPATLAFDQTAHAGIVRRPGTTRFGWLAHAKH